MNEAVHTILEVLGDGGTTDMANRVLVWLSGDTNAIGIKPDHIVGRAEIASLTGKSRQQLAKLINGNVAFPAPFRTLESGEELYDIEHVRRWIEGNPDLIGDPA